MKNIRRSALALTLGLGLGLTGAVHMQAAWAAEVLPLYYEDETEGLSEASAAKEQAEDISGDGLIEDITGTGEMQGMAAAIYETFLAPREQMGEHWAVAVCDPVHKEDKAGQAEAAEAGETEMSTETAEAGEAETGTEGAEAGGAETDTEAADTIYTYNGTDSLQSASVIKLFIMAAVYDRICYPASEEKAIHYTESYEGELRATLENMIQYSSNEDTNKLIDILGGGDTQTGKDVVNTFCKEHGFLGTHLGRKMLESAPTDDNYVSAMDVARLLRDIVKGEVVNAEASEKMLTILKGQSVKTKIPAGLPGDYLCANKTGEMPEGYNLGCIENDAAIVYPPGEEAPFILVALSNDLAGRNDEAQVVIRQIAAFTAEQMKEAYAK